MEGTAYKKMSVTSPVEGKDGKTYWKSMGIGFVNRDSSISIILEGLPVNGKLHVSEWKDWKEQPRLRQASFTDAPPVAPAVASDLPF